MNALLTQIAVCYGPSCPHCPHFGIYFELVQIYQAIARPDLKIEEYDEQLVEL